METILTAKRRAELARELGREAARRANLLKWQYHDDMRHFSLDQYQRLHFLRWLIARDHLEHPPFRTNR